MSFTTNKLHFFDFTSIIEANGKNIERGESEVIKEIRNIFDKSDLMSDSQRDDIHIFNNTTLMKEYPPL